MRNLTIIGPFAEVGKEEYAHTPYSQIYLAPAITGLFKAMYVGFLLLHFFAVLFDKYRS